MSTKGTMGDPNKGTMIKWVLLPTVLVCTGMIALALNWDTTPSSLSPGTYERYVRNMDNGLHKKKEVGDHWIDLQYEPSPYRALKAIGKEDLDSQKLVSFLNKAGDNDHFILRIGTEEGTDVLQQGIGGQEEYQKRVSYLANEMKMDLHCHAGQDTVDCVMFHFERTYGYRPYVVFSLGFPAGDENDRTIVFDDHAFGIGRVKFHFEVEDIQEVPELTLNQ